MRMSIVAAILTAVTLGTSVQQSIDVALAAATSNAAPSERLPVGAPAHAALPNSLIPNGSFDRDTSGWHSTLAPATSGQVAWAPHAGRKGGGALHVAVAAGDTRPFAGWSCTFDSLSVGRRLRVSAWVKGTRCGAAPVATTSIRGPDGNLSAATTGNALALSGDFDWTRIEVSVPVLAGARSAFLSLFLRSAGEAWFDDVEAVMADSLTAMERSAEPLEKGPGLLRIRSAWEYSLRAGATPNGSSREGPKVLLALPLDYGEQVPLSFELSTRPAGRIRASNVYQDRPGAWIAQVELAPLRQDERVVLDWTSVVIVGARSFSDLPQSAPMPNAWPEAARPWLAATRCAQADDPRIRRVAATIRDTSEDVISIIDRTLLWMSGLDTEGREMCSVFDAVQALDHRGSCVSRANLAAALLRANGIPARMLGGYPSWFAGPMQCHFVVEAFVPGFGWFPVEPTRCHAPVRPGDQINVSVVPPEYEDERAVRRRSGAAGLPYLSISELLGDANSFLAFGSLDRERGAAVAVTQIHRYPRDAPDWDRALAMARARWGSWLADRPTLDAQGILRTPLSADSLLGARSPSSLLTRLAVP